MKSDVDAISLASKILSLFLFVTSPLFGQEPKGTWSESVISIWDYQSQEYVETPVKIWDSRPEDSRSFNWDGEVDEAGHATGVGKLEWREKDAPEYGPEGLLTVYAGAMEEGRRSGKGRIRFANGERFDGAWKDDLPHGLGEFWFANGDYYQGDVANGRMEGEGTYVASGAEVYEGGFAAGKRHGSGTVQWENGVSYESEWIDGLETPESQGRREEAIALLEEKGNAVQVGLVTALSKNEKFQREGMKPLTYESYFEDGEFGFRPEAEFLRDYQEGRAVDSFLPEIGSLFMEMAFENHQSRQVVIERGEVEVIESVPDLTPYIIPWPGASEITFDLANAGWGGARNCVFDFNLHRSGEGPTPDSGETYEFQIKLGDFDERLLKVDMTEAFKECGVDVAFAMENQSNSMNFLGKWGKDQGDPVYGRFAKYDEEGLIESASIDLHGCLSYEWTDARGEQQSHSVRYTGFIQLIYLVEGGDAMGGYAKYDVGLRYEGENYRLPFSFAERVEPFRDARFGLDLNAEQSSFHRFRVVLHCSDGTTLQSPVCRVNLFRPRDLNMELYGADGVDGEVVMSEDSPYLFPDSHLRLLGDDELSILTADQLWTARNEIFARRGYIFGSDRGKELVGSLGDLYQPVGGIDEIDSLLNEIERANIEVIRTYENR